MAVTTKSAPQREERNARQRIINSAISLFSDLGYEKATTRELAARAGVSEGLIYRYFAGKRELLFAALEGEQEQRRNDPPLITEGSTLEEHVSQILSIGVERMLSRRDFMRVCMSLAPVDPELGHLVETIEQRTVRNLTARLAELQAEGFIDEQADLDAAASVLNMLVYGLAFNWQVIFGRSPIVVKRRLLAISGQLSRGLEPARPSAL
jgi:AcrR family transcriptional regulator